MCYKHLGRAITLGLLGILFFQHPALAGWSVHRWQDSMSDETQVIAYTINPHDYKLVIRAHDSEVTGTLILPDTSPYTLDTMLPRLRIDRHAAIDPTSYAVFTYHPKRVTFRLQLGIGKRRISDAISQLMMGTQVRIRFYTLLHGAKETVFSLSDSRQAIEAVLQSGRR